MRIITLNTWKNEGPYERRLDLMAEGLAALAPDVVCLQECFLAKGFDTASHLAAALGLEVTAAPARRKLRRHRGGDLESASGLALLHRQPLQAVGQLSLPASPRDGERIAQWADLATDLRLVNLHLTHLRGDGASALRHAQLDHVLCTLRTSGALLLAGDFNARSSAPELSALAGSLDPAAAPTLQGGRAEQARPDAPAVDHIALVAPKGWRIVRRFRGLDRPDADGWLPSDHAAVVADLMGPEPQ